MATALENYLPASYTLIPSAPLSERSYCVTLSRCVCIRRISLGGEGNVFYPVLSSFCLFLNKQISISDQHFITSEPQTNFIFD